MARGRHPLSTAGFEVVNVDLPPIKAMPNVIPTAETYHDTILNLARQMTRGSAYSSPFWSEHDGAKVRSREKTVKIPISPSLSFTLREKHLADKRPDESLKTLYAADSGMGTMLEQGQTISPRKLSVYDVLDRAIWEVVLYSMPAGTSYRDMYDLADMEIAAGRAQEDSLSAKHHLYIGLAILTGNPPPPINLFQGYSDFRL